MAAIDFSTTPPTDRSEDSTYVEDGPFAAIPMAPEDPMFGLSAAYRSDASPRKVDLGVGAYRDNNLEPFVLPVVKKVTIVHSTAISVILC